MLQEVSLSSRVENVVLGREQPPPAAQRLQTEVLSSFWCLDSAAKMAMDWLLNLSVP